MAPRHFSTQDSLYRAISLDRTKASIHPGHLTEDPRANTERRRTAPSSHTGNPTPETRPSRPSADSFMASGYTTPGEGVTIDHLDASHHNEEDQPLLPPSEREQNAPNANNEQWHKRVSVALKRLTQLEFTLVLSSWTILLTMVGFGFVALFAGSFFVTKPPPVKAIDNGVGKLPFMGYNTWNAYHCDIDENKVLDNAKLLVSLGLKDAGYNYMNIDDCYSEKKRNIWGDIVESKSRFGGGMRNLVDKIHDLGLKAGIYSDSGWFTCQLYPGSYKNEARDIKLFRETWGFDLLKYDNCAVPFDEIIKENIYGKYVRMATAISDLAKNTGKEPILFSLCEWGRQQPWLWAKRLGQSWRTTDDIGPYWNSLASIINENSFISWATDFYGRNDLDILEVGNGDLPYEEAKSHFTAWALMKSPLLISTELSSVTKETLEILTNKEIIAINQDPVVGTAITPFRWGINPMWTPNSTHPAQYWSGESQNGTVIMLLNTLNEPADMTFELTESPWLRAGRQYAVRDLWAHSDNGTAVRTFTAKQVPAHGVVALLLKDAGDEPKGTQPPCQVIEWCTDKNGTVLDPNNGW